MSTLVARVVSAPCDVLPGARGTVLGGSPSALYVEVGEFVAAITARSVPLMPNCISVDAPEIPEVAPGEDVSFSSAEIRFAATTVRLEGARRWSPVVARNSGRSTAEVGRRGRGVLRNCRVAPARDPESLTESLATAGLATAREPGGRKGTAVLLSAFAAADISAATEASSLLIGRGGGLTPEGDDLVGGAVAALVAFGSAAALEAKTQAALLEALCPPNLRKRTTALSTTLLVLAAQGMAVEPLLHILDLDEPPDQWRPELQRLLAIGHTTGRAWALGSAAASAMLGRKELSA